MRASACLAVLAAAAVAAGCGQAADERAATRAGGVAAADVERCASVESRLGSVTRAFAAVAERGAVVYRRPGGRELARFGRVNVNGFPTVFGVLGAVRDVSCRTTWYRVQVPVRPNGAAGYVRARAVRVLPVRERIVVDLSERRITLLRDGRRVLSTTTAIGSDATPTPTGRYYVNQRLRTADPSGPFGPGALGISAFSPVLTGWAQGGPVAIHGTNAPWSVGRAVSNGCLRVSNDVLRRLFEATPAGTPVVIKA